MLRESCDKYLSRCRKKKNTRKLFQFVSSTINTKRKYDSRPYGFIISKLPKYCVLIVLINERFRARFATPSDSEIVCSRVPPTVAHEIRSFERVGKIARKADEKIGPRARRRTVRFARPGRTTAKPIVVVVVVVVTNRTTKYDYRRCCSAQQYHTHVRVSRVGLSGGGSLVWSANDSGTHFTRTGELLLRASERATTAVAARSPVGGGGRETTLVLCTTYKKKKKYHNGENTVRYIRVQRLLTIRRFRFVPSTVVGFLPLSDYFCARSGTPGPRAFSRAFARSSAAASPKPTGSVFRNGGRSCRFRPNRRVTTDQRFFFYPIRWRTNTSKIYTTNRTADLVSSKSAGDSIVGFDSFENHDFFFFCFPSLV